MKEAQARLDAATAQIAARRGSLSTPSRRPTARMESRAYGQRRTTAVSDAAAVLALWELYATPRARQAARRAGLVEIGLRPPEPDTKQAA